jgi:hypothetical protein
MADLLFDCPDGNRPIVPKPARIRNHARTWDCSPEDLRPVRRGLRLIPEVTAPARLGATDREVKDMLALVMYESMFGNSERIAHAVADGLREVADVVVRDVATANPGDLPAGVDLLVAGGPTHALSMSRPGTREDAIRQGAAQGLASRGLREWLDGLPEDLNAVHCATFDTRVSRVRRMPGSAARSAARVLRRHCGDVFATPESFFVDDVPGPLAGDELDRARAWGRRLAGQTLTDGEPVEAG